MARSSGAGSSPSPRWHRSKASDKIKIMETTLTIQGLDAQTFDRLSREAGRRGIPVPVLARLLLEQSVEEGGATFHDLDALIGTWSDEQAVEFVANTAGMRGIDPELWR